jgi:hypothetical protein
MGVGKYSPTISSSYSMDQDWWERNGGGYGNGKNPNSEQDDDGYDSYGYSGQFGQGVDRAGHTEDDYLSSGEWIEDEYRYPLYEDVLSDWNGKFLGDLPNYIRLEHVGKDHGLPSNHIRLYHEFAVKGLRMIYSGAFVINSYIHRDDVEQAVEVYRKYLPKVR